ncbi:SRR1-like protein [Leptotrombidium deliense]|uniref:SRR1-like protein n=1 Tax=Leptotrombidium deliense TaxID=299467 RepID=A0A443SW52_9ACAR|nr:SRR1-like protein [Leptotrombidium deliense]
MNDQEFKVYVNKRRNKWKHKKFIANNNVFVEDELTREQLLRKIKECIEDVKHSRYFEALVEVIERNVELKPKAIVCYGLGRLAASNCSRYQFALLSLLKNTLDCQNVFVFDPIFTELDKDVLSNVYQCEIITENEKCKRRVGCEQVFFFMPHCDKALFNNLLWINWDVFCLSNVIIFGNSFSSMIDAIVSKEAKAQFNYLVNVLSLNLVNECRIENNFRLKDVFNDLSLHLFPVSEMDESVLSACYSLQSPVYNEENDVI